MARFSLWTRLCSSCVVRAGAELLVLSTLDWSRIRLGVLIAECAWAGCTGHKDVGVAEELSRRGMRFAATVRARHDIYNMVFVNSSWLPPKGWPS